jgi:hypothetical protein
MDKPLKLCERRCSLITFWNKHLSFFTLSPPSS